MKKSEQTVELSINATPKAAWEVIGAVTGVEKWLGAMIKGSRVEGQKRICTLDGGVEFREDILKIDHENREFKYGIPEQPMMPVDNIIGSMKVTQDANGKAVVRWHWTFDVAEENEAQAKEMLAGAGQMGIKGIEELIAAQVTA
ncbi:MAG TPA: hypothetical protein DCS93_37205 [Microscillaceae bacterium]|nr:hypothetical protein [Microscillaceae bacterium]